MAPSFTRARRTWSLNSKVSLWRVSRLRRLRPASNLLIEQSSTLLGVDGDIQVHEADLTVPHPELANRLFEQQLLVAAGFKPE